MNFRQLDLNLLRVLAAIHRTGSVTAAGKALALSQPATSNALSRLRAYFDDELFVRSPDGLKPTRLCERLAPQVQAQLQSLETLVVGRERFEPATSDIRWRLSLSDLGEMMFLPPLAAALREQAPYAHLTNVSVASDAVPAALEARDIDFAIGILQPKHRGVRAELLFREHYVAMTSARWRPAQGTRRAAARSVRTLTVKELAGASLAVASPTATFHGSVEQTLTSMKLDSRIVLRARHFGALPELCLSTDLMAIVPEMYAANLSQRHDLRVWELPRTAAPRYEVRLVWHASTAQDPAHQWIRAQVHRLFGRAAQGFASITP
ncbi:MAG: LysR family transcriptional regulator [Comamonadaceae bacterium]|nr:MAG: LysR family transcriptional regulator [Comamonadaceae bacterium]